MLFLQRLPAPDACDDAHSDLLVGVLLRSSGIWSSMLSFVNAGIKRVLGAKDEKSNHRQGPDFGRAEGVVHTESVAFHQVRSLHYRV